MVAVFQESITAEAIKAKARELGADLVGICLCHHSWLPPPAPETIVPMDPRPVIH
ncbi:MAG: hypothetical protein IID55_13270 [Proteobacteria bacterium]|nr:hypothetical protein [Pseudomonadota bacterium]